MNQDILNRVGKQFNCNNGDTFIITQISNSSNYTVEFADGNKMCDISYDNILKGKVKNPFYPSVFGIGYLGIGKYRLYINKKITNHGQLWRGILGRGFSLKIKEKQPTYKEVTVCEEWHNFQVFAEWFERNYNPEIMDGWCLDKDILVKGNKVYSPETCCFVPQEINNIFLKNNATRGEYPVGVHKQKNRYYTKIRKDNKCLRLGGYTTAEEAFQAYKTAKEQYIKEMADKWKDQINQRVYQAMYNYKVEITD